MAVSSGSVSVTLETSEWNKFIVMLLVLTGVQGGGPGVMLCKPGRGRGWERESEMERL